jgi:DNA-binding protein YbaB
MGNPFSQMGDLLKKQKEAKAMEKKMKAIKIQAESKDGKVVLFMNALQEIEDIHIDKSLLNPEMMPVIRKGFQEAMKDFKKKFQKVLMQDMDNFKGMLGI